MLQYFLINLKYLKKKKIIFNTNKNHFFKQDFIINNDEIKKNINIQSTVDFKS